MFRCRDIVGARPPVTLNLFGRKYVVDEGHVLDSICFARIAGGSVERGGQQGP
jgi:hypothetical protein